jgi:phenylalanine-4-hydroxylase
VLVPNGKNIRKSKDIYASLDPIFHRLKKTTQMTGYLLLKSMVLQDRNDSTLLQVLDYLDDLKQKTMTHLISGGLDLIFRKIITL